MSRLVALNRGGNSSSSGLLAFGDSNSHVVSNDDSLGSGPNDLPLVGMHMLMTMASGDLLHSSGGAKRHQAHLGIHGE